MPEHRLLIGACGWEHADWLDQFYPDDLPEDWRLGYYSNNYRVLLLPAGFLRGADFNSEAVLEDSNSSLQFIFELSASDLKNDSVLSEQLDRFNAFAERGSGIFCRVDESDANAVKKLLDPLQKCTQHLPVCVQLAADVDTNLLEDCAQRGLGVVWNGHAAPASHSKLNIARISETEMTAKELRCVIEACLAWGQTGETTVLLFDGEPPALQLMDNAGLILDLL